MTRLLQSAFALAVLSLIVSCSGGSNSSTTSATNAPSQSPTTAVSVNPATSQVILGNSTSFSATVTGSANTAVTWSLSGPGTLDPSGNYTAPADLPSSTTATITATSQASTTASGSATATVISDLTVSIQTSPAQTTSLPLGGTLSLTANVTSKGKPDTSVTWTVNGIAGGNATVGTIAGSAPVIYTAPSVLPSAAQVTIVAISAADPSKTASFQLTLGLPTPASGGVSVSNSSPIPLTPIAITGIPFAASSNTTLTFTDGNSYTFTENPIRVAADGTVIAAVPVYLTGPGVMGSGSVTLTLTDAGMTTAPIQLNVQELPSVASYGVSPGDLSHALFVHQSIITAQSLNTLQAVSGSVHNTVDASTAIASIKTQFQSALAAKNEIDEVAANPNLSIPQVTLTDGTQINFDSTQLDLSDRVIGVLLSGEVGSIAQAYLNNPAIRTKSDKKSQLAFARPFGSMSNIRATKAYQKQVDNKGMPVIKTKRNLHANDSGLVSGILGVFESVAGATSVQRGILEEVGTMQQQESGITNIIDQFSAIGGGLAPLVKELSPSFGLSQALAKTFGAYVGALGSLNTIAEVVGDGELYFYYAVQGQSDQAAMYAADFQGISAQKLGDAAVAILTLTPGTGLAVDAAAALYTFTSNAITFIDVAQTSTSNNGNMVGANATVLDVLQEASTVEASSTDGIGIVDGTVDISEDEGTEQPLVEVSMNPAPGAGDLATVTDQSGDFNLLVPLGQPSFDYSNSDLTVSSDSGNTLSSQSLDLSDSTVTSPTSVPTIDTTDPGDPGYPGYPPCDDPPCSTP